MDANVKPEKQILKPPNLATKPNPQNKPRLGKGRVGLRRKMKTPVQVQPQLQPREVSQIKEHTIPKQKEGIQTPLTKPQKPDPCIMPEHTIRPKMNVEQIPFYQYPLMKPPSPTTRYKNAR